MVFNFDPGNGAFQVWLNGVSQFSGPLTAGTTGAGPRPLASSWARSRVRLRRSQPLTPDA